MKKVAAPGLENRDLRLWGPGGGRSVGIVRVRTKATEFSYRSSINERSLFGGTVCRLAPNAVYIRRALCSCIVVQVHCFRVTFLNIGC